MGAPRSIGSSPPPRRRGAALRWLALALLGLFLTSGFVFIFLPWDRLRAPLAAQIEAATGIAARIDRIEPVLLLPAPALGFYGMQLTLPDGDRVEIEELRLRPAFSSEWLHGVPSVRFRLRSEQGDGDGTFSGGATPGARGHLSNLDLALLARLGRLVRFGLPSAEPALEGRLDADFDLARSEDLWLGTATWVAREGRIDPASLGFSLPFPIPFELFSGSVHLPADGKIELEDLALSGDLFDAKGAGFIQQAQGRRPSQIDILLELTLLEPSLLPLASQFGIDLDADGRAALQITGSLYAPRVIRRSRK